MPLDLEDLTILDDMVVVWLAEDKTHKGEEQTIYLHDREDLRLVFRIRRCVGYLAEQGITAGPVFREVLRGGKVAHRRLVGSAEPSSAVTTSARRPSMSG